MKKTNNKGFSLVELIVVIAIMAVLMVIVAPQMLCYVERTRIQRDNSAIAEIANAIKIAVADETVNNSVPDAGETYTASTAGVFTFNDATAGGDALDVELNAALGATVTLTSDTYTTAGNEPVITITKSGLNITVTGSNLRGQDGRLLNDPATGDTVDTDDGVLVY